jgi:O-antigen ligase
MAFSYLFLIFLMIAPQLWFEPLKGLRVDFFTYPLWFFYLLVSRKLLKSGFNFQDKFFLFFVIWIMISLVANGNLFVREPNLGLMFVYYIKLFVLYILTSRSFDRIGDITCFIGLLCIICITLSIEGIQHKFSGIGWAGQSLGWISSEAAKYGISGRTRWVGIFDGPGVFSVIYSTALPFLLNGVRKIYSRTIRIFSVISIPLVMVAIYFNGSRGGMLATLFVWGIHFLASVRRKKMFMMIGGVLCSAIIAIAPSYLIQVDDPEKSSDYRIEMWSEGLEMIIQNPVFGIGRGNFAQYTGKLVAHCSPIEIMGETGVVGFMAWIGIIYMGFKSLNTVAKSSPDTKEKNLALALMISIAGYIVSSVFVTLEYETFYMLLGLSRIAHNHRDAKEILNRRDIRNILGIAIGWVFIVYVMVNFYKNLFW